MKKRFAWCVVCLLFCVLLPFTVLASGEFSYILNVDGRAVITGYSGSGGEVTVPWQIDKHLVVEIGTEAFAGQDGIRTIILPERVQVIRYGAFRDCAALENVTMPEKLETIEDEAFLGCTNLGTLEIPENVSEFGENCFEPGIFLLCKAGSAAEQYAQYYGLFIASDFAAEEAANDAEDDYVWFVENGGAVITSYIGKDYDVVVPQTLGGYPVRRIAENAFSSRYEVETVVLPEGLTTLDENAFRFCKYLRSIDFPTTLESIGERAFYQCTALTSIVLHEGLTSIGQKAFLECHQLREITLPASLRSIPYYVFYECARKITVYAPQQSAARDFAWKHGYTFVPND